MTNVITTECEYCRQELIQTLMHSKLSRTHSERLALG